jgi:hypothetical protein
MIRLISGYSDYSTDDLSNLAETVAANLPGLGIFATLKPTPVQITAAVTALQQAVMMKGPARTQAIKAAFNALAELLGQIADNAPQVANVTDTDLAAIGLPLAKTPTRTTTPPAMCQNLRLSNGPNSGEISGRCTPVDANIRVYEGQVALDPNGVNGNGWSIPETFPNSRAFKWSGLTRGKDIWVRVRARNTVGAGPWSDPATIMVT